MASNPAASARARLLALARERGEDFQLLLTRYGLERFLYRLGRTDSAADFVLKGAMLFSLWSDAPHRATRDIDLLGFGEASAGRLIEVFRKVCAVPCPDDGLEFDPISVRGEEIREAQEYGGFRINLVGRLEAARCPVQLDVGFGDAVSPGVREIDYPTILPMPAPHLRAYPPETVIAEKAQALVALGMANSRMKDFYDLLILARQFSFDRRTLATALVATFERRRTSIPAEASLALTEEFASDPAKGRQWRAFLARIGVQEDATALTEVVGRLAEFLLPLFVDAAAGIVSDGTWSAGGPWAE
ncbi:MAG: nucleotidyl transferase AbiEii/AbiGii toxin family protein [Deltaproteobacteria bacterium]|nr:nucleotidyl transferase AbiEii/AbiGii toxin family protein [Deltaproteobacteria bacterium]